MFIPLLAKSIYCSLYKPWSFENLFIWFIHILFQTFRIIIKFGPAPGHYNWAVSSLGLSLGIIYKCFHSFISYLFQLFMLWLLRLGWQYIVSLSMLHQKPKYASNIILVSFPSSFTQHSQPSMPRGTLQHCAMYVQCVTLAAMQNLGHLFWGRSPFSWFSVCVMCWQNSIKIPRMGRKQILYKWVTGNM